MTLMSKGGLFPTGILDISMGFLTVKFARLLARDL